MHVSRVAKTQRVDQDCAVNSKHVACVGTMPPRPHCATWLDERESMTVYDNGFDGAGPLVRYW